DGSRSGAGIGGEQEGSGFFFARRRRHTRVVSDWSSDVCSSDLWPRLPRVATRIEGDEARGADKAARGAWLANLVTNAGDDEGNEIGRASCRERRWDREGAAG